MERSIPLATLAEATDHVPTLADNAKALKSPDRPPTIAIQRHTKKVSVRCLFGYLCVLWFMLNNYLFGDQREHPAPSSESVCGKLVDGLGPLSKTRSNTIIPSADQPRRSTRKFTSR